MSLRLTLEQPPLRRTRLWQFTVSTRLARLMLPPATGLKGTSGAGEEAGGDAMAVPGRRREATS
jgi:hypothetical protein